MTFAEVKSELINLGFESSYEEAPSLLTDSINRAMQDITSRFPLIGRCEITVTSGKGMQRFNMRELTTDGFIEVDHLMVDDESGYHRASGWMIEQRYILLLSGDRPGNYVVFYRRNFTPLLPDSPEKQELEIDTDRKHLLPLLAAWYLWQDDEPEKAALWRNDYEDFAARLENKTQPTMVEQFVNGLGW